MLINRLSVALISFVLVSCTISFSNISTIGEASDVSDLEASPDVNTTLDLPLL